VPRVIPARVACNRQHPGTLIHPVTSQLNLLSAEKEKCFGTIDHGCHGACSYDQCRGETVPKASHAGDSSEIANDHLWLYMLFYLHPTCSGSNTSDSLPLSTGQRGKFRELDLVPPFLHRDGQPVTSGSPRLPPRTEKGGIANRPRGGKLSVPT